MCLIVNKKFHPKNYRTHDPQAKRATKDIKVWKYFVKVYEKKLIGLTCLEYVKTLASWDDDGYGLPENISKNKLKAPMRPFTYERGYVYYQIDDSTGSKFTFVDDFYGKQTSVHQGLHAFQTLRACKKACGSNSRNTTIVKCTIPKGALYYLGVYDDIVTDQLYIPK